MKKLIVVLFLSNLSLAVFSQYGEDDYKEKVHKKAKSAAIVPSASEVKGVVKHDSILTKERAPYQFTEVVKIDSVSKDELYQRSLNWFVRNYKSSSTVIQLKDKETGQITGKALFSYTSKIIIGRKAAYGNVYYTIQIFVKEGRYKYEINDLIHKAGYLSNIPTMSLGLITNSEIYTGKVTEADKDWYNECWLALKTKTKIEIEKLALSLKEGMKKETETIKNNW